MNRNFNLWNDVFSIFEQMWIVFCEFCQQKWLYHMFFSLWIRFTTYFSTIVVTFATCFVLAKQLNNAKKNVLSCQTLSFFSYRSNEMQTLTFPVMGWSRWKMFITECFASNWPEMFLASSETVVTSV